MDDIDLSYLFSYVFFEFFVFYLFFERVCVCVS
jgi:hypothetical protein